MAHHPQNDEEYRHTRERLGELEANLEELSRASAGDSGVGAAVTDSLEMQMEDLRSEISRYEDLKAGRLLAFEAGDLDSLGELLVKARIARDLTQSEMARKLGMTQQQIARYERDGYQKISLWRLAEIADALGLELSTHAYLRAGPREPIEQAG